MLFRVLWRLPTVLAGTIFGSGTILISRLLRPFGPRFARRLRHFGFRSWARIFCRATGARTRVLGQPPSGAFFLVVNHVSYVDIPLIAAHLDGAFVAKADLQSWPMLGRAFRVADTIFIDRGQKRDLLRVMDLVAASLESGLPVVLFPEGTSGKGDCILPLKPSLLELAARRQIPVHYATLSYRTPPGYPPAHQRICWWDDTPFSTHIFRLLGLPYYEATLSFGPQAIGEPTRKALAQKLHAAMTESLIPMD